VLQAQQDQEVLVLQAQQVTMGQLVLQEQQVLTVVQVLPVLPEMTVPLVLQDHKAMLVLLAFKVQLVL
jgi:hypothetical protein